MIDDFKQVLEKITQAKRFQTFKEKHSNYYLAHGFIQLDHEWKESKEWQVGWYSKKNDDLAIFTRNPVKLQGFEKAFKEEGKIIEELKELDDIKDTNFIIEVVKDHINTEYPDEKVRTVIVILQMVKGTPMYNITTVTESFTMIITKVNAKTATIVSSDKRSVLELKKE